MKMKIKSIYVLLACTIFILNSCSEYLDKVERADVSSDDVFKDFVSFQGFVETMYNAIVAPDKSGRNRNDINVGDDCEYAWQLNWDWSHSGNYWGILNNQAVTEFYWPPSEAAGPEYALAWSNSQSFRPSYWGGWQAIRVANIALENMDQFTGTTEERQLLEGQAYFFRAYFHWEILRLWGRIPYIDIVFDPSSDMKIPALSFHETAEKIMTDLEKAAELLPVDWDLTTVGSNTQGNNYGRLTKGMAYAFQAEVMLWCGSPMVNGTVTGNYNYDEDFCKRSAAAAWELIKLANQGVYLLEPWATYSNMFYKIDGTWPGGKEIIFAAITNRHSRNTPYSNQNMTFQHLGGGNKLGSPTATYVERFETASGLPIEDPESGYNPMNPWANRDPRFYYNIVKDRDRIVQRLPLTDRRAVAELYVGGRDKTSTVSKTGYGYKKFIHLTCNSIDNGWAAPNWTMHVPRLRLSEIYLIYAEAVNEAYGPGGTHPEASFTALQAVNIVRTRAGVPDVNAKFTSSKEAFRARIWNERAVELAFEGKGGLIYDVGMWRICQNIRNYMHSILIRTGHISKSFYYVPEFLN
jgi:starch-binding outer membrane protein, SusD/RagB family